VGCQPVSQEHDEGFGVVDVLFDQQEQLLFDVGLLAAGRGCGIEGDSPSHWLPRWLGLEPGGNFRLPPGSFFVNDKPNAQPQTEVKHFR
jgi:hypothetical protein